MAPEIKFLQQQDIMLLADRDRNRSTFWMGYSYHITSPQLCFVSEYDVQLLEVDGYLEQKLNYVVLYCKWRRELTMQWYILF